MAPVKSPAWALEEYSEGNTARRFRRRHHHHKKHEDLATQSMPVSGESHEGKIYAVEHELNRHKTSEDVPLDQESGNTAREQEAAQQQVIRKRDHQRAFRFCVASGFVASTTAPMIAINIKMDVTSKGKRNSWKSNWPIVFGSPSKAPTGADPVPEWRNNTQATRVPPISMPGTPSRMATRLPSVRSSSPAFNSMMVKTNSTILAPAYT